MPFLLFLSFNGLLLCSVPRGIPRFFFLLFPGIQCRHLFIFLAGCYPAFRCLFVCFPAFSSTCSRDFSSALSSSHTSLQTSHVPLYVPGCLPISSGSVAQSVPLGTFGNNTRLFSIALLVFRWALSVLLSLFFNYYSFSFASRSHYGHLRNVFSSSCSRVFSHAPPFCPLRRLRDGFLG